MVESAIYAARRSNTVATILITVLSLLLALAFAGCAGAAVVEHHRYVKLAAIGGALAVLLSWLAIMLLCLGAQALAEHIDLQARKPQAR